LALMRSAVRLHNSPLIGVDRSDWPISEMALMTQMRHWQQHFAVMFNTQSR